jgi:hypothetical protein
VKKAVEAIEAVKALSGNEGAALYTNLSIIIT